MSKKYSILNASSVPKILLTLVMSMTFATPALADISPAGCTGSGLGINLFTNIAQGSIGDTISYTAVVFNGASGGPLVCDATGITASIVTPDGVNHPLTLTRTTLLNGEFDVYSNVVTYVAAAVDIKPDGTLKATASDTGVIHQNITNSAGGGNQGVNVYVLNTLHIVKNVVNTGGGTSTAATFNVHVKSGVTDIGGSPVPGIGAPGTLYSIIAGTYTVSEDANASYVVTFSGDCDATGNVTVIGGNDKTCTITNTFVPPASLTVNKVVINDSGGTSVAASFPLFVNTTAVVTGVSNVFPPGAYTVSETINPNYAQTFGGDCSVTGTVTLVPGDAKTCTITNDDIPPLAASINVVKIVVNDSGRTLVIADFPLFVGSTTVASGMTNIFPPNPAYVIHETVDPNYVQSFSGDCNSIGVMSLAAGENKICTITNDDIAAVVPPTTGGGGGTIPPLIDVVKLPNPLALPNGPGSVTYTYTVRNIGVVAMNNVTMVDDSCSPLAMVSGDINANTLLDLNETWVYSCTVTLSATRTNTVTATGWANGISASDVALATVVVGVPIVPPLIHVTKLPSPLSLFVGGGVITYTYHVTNPGVVALSNVLLVDDKCSAVQFISGDLNGDAMLGTNEDWTYTCQTNLTRTTTDTAIATGQANGITVRDVAIATVLVSIPGLPNTGFAPDGMSLMWNIALLSGILAVAWTVVKKNRTRKAA